MNWREHHFRWQWSLEADIEALWPLIADTNHFDQDTGMNQVVVVDDSDASLVNGRQRLQVTLMGFPTEFVQEPFEWSSPYCFGVTRRFSRGPMGELRVRSELTPRAEGGTLLTYEVWSRPRTLLGAMTIPLASRLILQRRFERTFRHYDQIARRGGSFYNRPETALALEPVLVKADFAPGGRERLAEIQRELGQQTNWPHGVDRLVRLIAEADDVTLSKIRPYALADAWNVSRRQVLELALLATRVGLLDFRWELLCPMCRSARAEVSALADTTREVHCESCQIDYKADFERSVELTFRPNAAIRQIEENVEFCYAGPAAAPHILLQQLLQPGEEREVRPRLDPGRYKMRTLGLPGEQSWNVTTDGALEQWVIAKPEGWSLLEETVAPQPTIHLINQTNTEQLFILERASWSDHAATAAEVIILQRFRDLFSQEALRPGEQIFVGTQTIVFTDLRGSTQMYRTIGDAPAFGLVMDHFDILREEVAREGGSIVKTIGDAVMAVFRQPAAALRAMQKAQQRLAQVSQPLQLKVGLHTGPCIAVTLNERLDFFGSTVNLAARLQAFSSGDDIIMSHGVYTDPEVAAWRKNLPEGGQWVSFETNLKGFAEDCFTLWRVNHW
ncbi:MAG: adenylate/guanylate cyclase domain-containing protein [Chloroflexi bacterium]|nr:adenylate/guanylate cyclase domain-containing protein [Chloroflexota bacterium]